MIRFFTAAVLIVFATGGVMSQNPADVHGKIRRLIESRDYAGAVSELRTLQAANDKAFRDNNYDYLLGRMAEAAGQPALAMASYQAAANRDSPLRAYALKHLSEIARSTGNLMLERIYLNEILLSSPKSLLAESVHFRQARNRFESENYVETIRLLESGGGQPLTASTKKFGEKPYEREYQALLADAYLRNGNAERSREIFTNLLDTMPNAAQPDDAALTATRRLDLLDGGQAGRKAPGLAESEHLRRANIYHFNREFADAKLHFEAVIAANGANIADAIFQIGRGHAQRREFAEALIWFERIRERHSGSPVAAEALLNGASAYARVGKSKEAITRYQTFIEQYPADEKLERAYLNIIDVHRDQGEETEALKWCAKAREAFAGRLPATLALFSEARIYLAKEDWRSALHALERLKSSPDLGGPSAPGGTNAAEIAFLNAFVLEQLKRYPEAIDAYLAIPDGRAEYYGWRASERLRSLAGEETAASHISQKLGFAAAGLTAKDIDARRKNALAVLRLTDSSQVREKALGVLNATAAPKGLSDFKLEKPDFSAGSLAGELLELGLYDEAAPEIEAEKSAVGGHALARYYQFGGRAHRGIEFIEPLWRKVSADYPIELMPRGHLEMLYPAPYADALLKFAPPRGVDPRLVLAVMRQESRFQPDAKSYSAARGLMQFISSTATRVAGELGRENFDQNELYYPPTAILFGSQYLGGLFKAFPGQPEAVAAAYNAGDDNMKRWLARSRSRLPERHVPEIAYSQTKDYVYKVMANYRMYQFLYDENLKPR